MAQTLIDLLEFGPDPALGWKDVTQEEVEEAFLEAMRQQGYAMIKENPLYHVAIHQSRQFYKHVQAQKKNWESGLLPKATGIHVNLLGKFLLESKKGDRKARVWCKVAGAADQVIAVDDVKFTAENGETFTSLAGVLNNLGLGDILFEAEVAGAAGTIDTNSVVSFTGTSITDVQNPTIDEAWIDKVLAVTITDWLVLPQNHSGTYYQEVDSDDISSLSAVRQLTGFYFRPQSGADEDATLRFDIYDQNGTLIASTEELDVTLPGAGTALDWVGHAIDCTGTTKIRVSPVVVDAEGVIEIGTAATGGQAVYANGEYYENSVASGKVLVGEISSALDGLALYGRDAEDDVDFKLRWNDFLAVPGFGNPFNIEEWIKRLRHVRDAKVRFNPEDETDEDGIPPHKMHIVVDGGILSEVAETVWRRTLNTKFHGTRKIPVSSVGSNQSHIVALDVVTNLDLAFRVEVEPTPLYTPEVDNPLIQEQVVKYVGGPDRSRTLAEGLGIGDIVSQEKAADFIFDIPNGRAKFIDVNVLIGLKGGTLYDADFRDVTKIQRVRAALADVEVVTI